jgi:hypothetical protein
MSHGDALFELLAQVTESSVKVKAHFEECRVCCDSFDESSKVIKSEKPGNVHVPCTEGAMLLRAWNAALNNCAQFMKMISMN